MATLPATLNLADSLLRGPFSLQLLGAARPVSDISAALSGAALRGADLLMRNAVRGLVGVVGVVRGACELDEHTKFTQTTGKACKVLKSSRRQGHAKPSQSARRLQSQLSHNAALTFSISSDSNRPSLLAVHQVARRKSEERLPADIGFQASLL